MTALISRVIYLCLESLVLNQGKKSITCKHFVYSLLLRGNSEMEYVISIPYRVSTLLRRKTRQRKFYRPFALSELLQNYFLGFLFRFCLVLHILCLFLKFQLCLLLCLYYYAFVSHAKKCRDNNSIRISTRCYLN